MLDKVLKSTTAQQADAVCSGRKIYIEKPTVSQTLPCKVSPPQADGVYASLIKQNISTPKWVLKERRFMIACLRGLLETDGSIYEDRGYKMINFVSAIPTLAQEVQTIIDYLGFSSHFYKASRTPLPKYTVRISRNTEEFIKKIGFIKN